MIMTRTPTAMIPHSEWVNRSNDGLATIGTPFQLGFVSELQSPGCWEGDPVYNIIHSTNTHTSSTHIISYSLA